MGDGVIILAVNAGEGADVMKPGSNGRKVLIALVDKIGYIAQDGDSRPNAGVPSLRVGYGAVKTIMDAGQETGGGIIPRTILADKAPDVVEPGRGALAIKIVLIEQISNVTQNADSGTRPGVTRLGISNVTVLTIMDAGQKASSGVIIGIAASKSVSVGRE